MIFRKLLLWAAIWATTVLFLTSPTAIAKPESSALKRQLIETQRHVVAVMAYFHLYQTSHGDNQYTKALTRHLLACKDQLAQLRAELSESGMETDADTLQSQWNYTAQSLNSSMASLKRGGFLEQSVAERYRQSIIGLYQNLTQLNQQLFIEDQPQVQPKWEQVAELGLLMQQMSLRYLDNNWVKAGVRANLSLEQMALMFDRQLQQLEQTEGQNSAVTILKAVRSKWNVLGTAMVSDPDHPVPYLVTRYGNDIVEQLQSLTDLN